jgi:agmatine/peptidylarginine deiminase
MTRLALVYPEKLPQKGLSLTHFYNDFIAQLLNCAELQELTLFHRPGLKDTLKKRFGANGGKLILQESPQIQDIWIRDFGFIRHGGQLFLASYKPVYYPEKDLDYALQDQQAIVSWATQKGLNWKQLSFQGILLVMDGGEFISNGKDMVVTTARAAKENRAEFERMF